MLYQPFYIFIFRYAISMYRRNSIPNQYLYYTYICQQAEVFKYNKLIHISMIQVNTECQAVHQFGPHTLTSKLHGQQLKIILETCKVPEEQVNIFQICLTNEDLTQDLRVVFGSTHNLFRKCLQKQENYVIDMNGIIKIFYTITLESQEIRKQISLHLHRVHLSGEEKLRKLLNQSKMDTTRVTQQLEMICQKQDNNRLFPVFREINQYFRFFQNQVTYIQDKKWNMTVFQTKYKHSNAFSFITQFRNNNNNTIIGLVGQQGIHQNTTYGKQLPHFAYQIRSGVIRTIGRCDHEELIRVFRPGSTYLSKIVIKVNKTQGWIEMQILVKEEKVMQQRWDLGGLKNMRLYPFIDFYDFGASLHISLAS